MKKFLELPFAGQPAQVFSRQVRGLATRLKKMNCRTVVLGISGGLDSTLALLVSHAAFLRLGWPLRGICAYTMPGFGTTRRTRGNAELLCEGLGIALETIDITRACRQHFRDIGHDPSVHDVVFENAQARERTQILMDLANKNGGIVLGTGDLSEIALGWSTYNGDHMSMFAVNSGVPKTVVREVCAWWAKKNGDDLPQAARAVRDIVATPISPELVPGQVTEDKLGPYDLHDFFIQEYCGRGRAPATVKAAAKRTFADRYDAATVEKWYAVFARRLRTQAFKRNCAPDGIKVFTLYFGPFDWYLPSV